MYNWIYNSTKIDNKDVWHFKLYTSTNIGALRLCDQGYMHPFCQRTLSWPTDFNRVNLLSLRIFISPYLLSRGKHSLNTTYNTYAVGGGMSDYQSTALSYVFRSFG